MKLKRAISFGLLLWIAAFVSISIIMFLPWFKDSDTRVRVAWFVLEIPAVLLLAKWYFKTDAPTVKKGFILGIAGLLVGSVLDAVITIPLFVSEQYANPYTVYFTDWMLYIGFAIVLILTTYAGYEFDGTYTKRESVEN